MASPDKVGLLQQAQSQSKRALKLELARPAEFSTDDDDDAGDDVHGRLLGRSDADNDDEDEPQGRDDGRRRLLGNSLYIDSPRGAGPDESDLSDAEIARRRRVGVAVLAGFFLSILTCVMLLHFLSNQESFGALPPIMQRLMGATITKGVKESLEQYTAGVRHTGTTGNDDFAKYIRAKAVDFGIDESFIKLDRFEILVNEPETLKLELRAAPKKPKAGAAAATAAPPAAPLASFDFVAAFKARSKAAKARVAFPPFHLYAKNGSAAGALVYAHFGGSDDYAALQRANVSVAGKLVFVRMGGALSLPAKVLLAGKFGAAAVLTYNDPADDGGRSMPDGPWRAPGDAAYGSVYMGNGDPSTLDGSSSYAADRMSVDEVFSENNTFNLLPPVPSMPVSAAVVKELLLHASKPSVTATSNKTAPSVFAERWPTSGGLVNASYSVELFSGSRANASNSNAVVASMEARNKYALRNVTNVLVTVRGTREADRYVIVGAQRDSTTASAADVGSGNAVFLEVLRAVGDLLSNGWRPHRTLLLASFDGEQFGSVGSSAWIDWHFSHLSGRGVVYLNMHDVVRGSGTLHCEAAASLRKNVYLVSAAVAQPESEVDAASFFTSGKSSRRLDADPSAAATTTVAVSADGAATTPTVDSEVAATEDEIDGGDSSEEPGVSLLPLNTTFGREDLPDADDSVFSYWLEDTRARAEGGEGAALPTVDLPGTTGRISPFLARLAIPTVELDFDGGYLGVEGTSNDTLEWMSKFGDPGFAFHRAAAQLYGGVLLSFSDAIFLQYDFTEVARDLRHGEAYLVAALQRSGMAASVPLTRLRAAIASFERAAIASFERAAIASFERAAIASFERAAVAVAKEMHEMTEEMASVLSGELVVDFKRVRETNTRLLMTEKAFLLPAGPPREPWLKHALYGFSEWDDYRAGFFPGVTQQLADGNSMTARRELTRLCVAIEQAADTLSTTVL